jgi:hypothetical protein
MASRLMLPMNTCASASRPLMSRWPSFAVLFASCTVLSMDASLLETTCAAFSRLMQTGGFPGCVGSIDCQHWSWEACPIQFAGHFNGKEKKPTIVLEAVADGDMARSVWLPGQSQRLEHSRHEFDNGTSISW